MCIFVTPFSLAVFLSLIVGGLLVIRLRAFLVNWVLCPSTLCVNLRWRQQIQFYKTRFNVTSLTCMIGVWCHNVFAIKKPWCLINVLHANAKGWLIVQIFIATKQPQLCMTLILVSYNWIYCINFMYWSMSSTLQCEIKTRTMHHGCLIAKTLVQRIHFLWVLHSPNIALAFINPLGACATESWETSKFEFYGIEGNNIYD